MHQQIDWDWRFDKMQQHTGEHILSGTLHRLFGAENVGFHIGSEAVRMDTSVPISPRGSGRPSWRPTALSGGTCRSRSPTPAGKSWPT